MLMSNFIISPLLVLFALPYNKLFVLDTFEPNLKELTEVFIMVGRVACNMLLCSPSVRGLALEGLSWLDLDRVYMFRGYHVSEAIYLGMHNHVYSTAMFY